MKKIKVLLGALALIASLALIGCTPAANPAPAAFDGTIDLTGKTVKNAEAFAGKWQGGFVTSFDAVTLDDFKTLKVEAEFTDADGNVIAVDWSLGQYLLLKDSAGSWDGDNLVKTQYNLGKQDMDLTGITGTAKGIAFQSSDDKVKFITIKSIKFVK